ncbi:hypothetical protein P3342_010106 [Pyrenophora teres f. teres]|nr:hypothetical protein P3342_010106 [Pyrenophora teres f. teres]
MYRTQGPWLASSEHQWGWLLLREIAARARVEGLEIHSASIVDLTRRSSSSSAPTPPLSTVSAAGLITALPYSFTPAQSERCAPPTAPRHHQHVPVLSLSAVPSSPPLTHPPTHPPPADDTGAQLGSRSRLIGQLPVVSIDLRSTLGFDLRPLISSGHRRFTHAQDTAIAPSTL